MVCVKRQNTPTSTDKKTETERKRKKSLSKRTYRVRSCRFILSALPRKPVKHALRFELVPPLWVPSTIDKTIGNRYASLVGSAAYDSKRTNFMSISGNDCPRSVSWMITLMYCALPMLRSRPESSRRNASACIACDFSVI